MFKHSVDYSPARRYLLAAAAAMLAAALHWGMFHVIGARVPFLFFLPALTLTSMLLGRGPGFLVVAAGLVSAVLSMSSTRSIEVESMQDGLALLAYSVTGSLLVAICSRWRLTSMHAAEVEKHLRIMQESTEVGFFGIDFVRERVFVSDAVWKLTGRQRPAKARSEGYVTLAEWQELLRATGVARESDLLKQKAKAGRYEHEHHILRPDGQACWLLSKVSIERNAEGKAVRLYCASLDITDRKRTELLLEETREELWRQLADFRRLHELSNEILEASGLNAQLAAVLRALAEFSGAAQGLVWLCDPASERLTVCASMGFSERALNRLASIPKGAGACGIAVQEQRRVIIDDVSTAPSLADFRDLAMREGVRAVHSTPLIGLSGDVLGVISVHFPRPFTPDDRELRLADICAQKAAMLIERARVSDMAEQSERRFRVVVDSSALAFVLLAPVRDDGGCIVDFTWQYLNSAAAEQFRCEGARIVGQQVVDSLPAGWDAVAMINKCAHALDSGVSCDFELRVAVADGTRWFRSVASPLPEGVAVWFRDITVEKTQEHALRDADRRKDEFLAMLAHELRNPLAPIRQAARIVAQTGESAQRQQACAVIERQVVNMALLLDDLLDVGRITSGKLVLKKSVVTVRSVVDTAVEMVRPLVDARKQVLRIDLPPVSLGIEADPLRVSQILFNLLANAAKYTPEGGHIDLHATPCDDGMRFEVRDDGIGISSEALPYTFEMFYQINDAGGANPGLGIGLALSRSLARLHGGWIEAASEGEGKGSCFTVFLPGPLTTHAETPAVEAAMVVRRPRRVLVADDNEDAAETLAELLRLDGNDVSVAFDGAQALEAFEAFEPEFAFLDVGMPKMNGFELARRVRSQARQTTLVAVTGWGQAGDRTAALEAGFDHHMTKPVDPRRIFQLLS